MEQSAAPLIWLCQRTILSHSNIFASRVQVRPVPFDLYLDDVIRSPERPGNWRKYKTIAARAANRRTLHRWCLRPR